MTGGEDPMPDVDRYPFLNPRRQRVATPEDVMALVRATWPTASQSGSTGYERSWTIRTPEGQRLVAHSWSPTRDMRFFWVRVAPTMDETCDADVWNDPRAVEAAARLRRSSR